jgi:hypothetical protein
MTTLPFFQQNQAPALACFVPAIDLCPKLSEVIRGRKQGKDDNQSQRDTTSR